MSLFTRLLLIGTLFTTSIHAADKYAAPDFKNADEWFAADGELKGLYVDQKYFLSRGMRLKGIKRGLEREADPRAQFPKWDVLIFYVKLEENLTHGELLDHSYDMAQAHFQKDEFESRQKMFSLLTRWAEQSKWAISSEHEREAGEGVRFSISWGEFGERSFKEQRPTMLTFGKVRS